MYACNAATERKIAKHTAVVCVCFLKSSFCDLDLLYMCLQVSWGNFCFELVLYKKKNNLNWP